MTEDKVRDLAGRIFGFKYSPDAKSGVGQITSFNNLGFSRAKVALTVGIAKEATFGLGSTFLFLHSLGHYLSAIEETSFGYADTYELSTGRRRKMTEAYENHYGRKLTIPRWEDIEEIYRPKKK